VVSILAGPASTVVVGYANGVLGLYSLADGGRLAEVQLHGPVSHLLLEGHRLYAATELGRHLTWDLDALHGDWCAVLENVWRRVPVVWSAGRAELREPPGCRSPHP
jgi:hypothetical protein